MLKDSLSNLLIAKNDYRECKMGKLVKSLDSETAIVLKEAMTGSASTMDLLRALRSEGHSFCREYLAEKRKCFKDGDAAEMCCISGIIQDINNPKNKGTSK